MPDTNLFTTFPDAGLYSLPVGKNLFDINKGIMKDADGVIVPIAKHASEIKPLKHLWIFVDNDVDAEIRYKGEAQYVGRVGRSGFNFQDLTFDEFTIITTVATDIQVIGSISDVAQVGFSVEGIGTNRPLLSIDGDTYFTDALVTDASENENIITMGNKLKVTNITIYSIQSLNYRLWFYTADTFGANDIIGYIDLNLIVNGVTKVIGATTYYVYSVVDADIPYEDLDETAEFHLQLENKSVVAKNAGATGKVQLTLGYEVL